MEVDKKDVKLSYETLWKFIIRPPRDNYEEDYLVDEFFIYKNKQYQRKDYDLLSSEGYIMKCSFIEPIDTDRPTIEMPAVLYLHGNSSSRMEGLLNLTLLLNLGINLFVFDFPGCGLSEGEYISLGYHERDDVKIVMDFLEKIPGVGNIGIWGRSMGAATTLFYAHTDPRVKAICLDSPFERFDKLAEELVTKYINLPKFLIDVALKIIRNTIKSKNGLDISKLNPIEEVEKTYQPAIFVHAINDELIKVEHSINLFNNYGGPKSLKCCDTGGHNTRRPKLVKNEIGEFFKKYLFDKGMEEDLMKKFIDKDVYNIVNNINNNDDDFEEFEEEEDDTPQDNGNDVNININEDMLEEDYIMNQIYESQKGEKNKNEINDNNININKINNNINKNNSNNLNKKEKKDNKNNLEEKRIEKIMQQEKDQMEQMKQALLSLNLENNNNENNNSNNINDININIKDDNDNNNENKFENSENVDLLNEEEYKNNSGNNDNLENGGKF